MAVDWSKSIEAVEKATGRVVPMAFVGADYNQQHGVLIHKTRTPPADNVNENWYPDGRDFCDTGLWFIRNTVTPTPAIDWTKPLELEDGTPVVVVGGPFSKGSEYEYYTVERLDGETFTDEQAEGYKTACWEWDGQRYRPFSGDRSKGLRVRNRETPETPAPQPATITVTGLPVPDGFAEVMKHTIVGGEITGILISAPYSVSITTPQGTYEFRLSQIN